MQLRNQISQPSQDSHIETGIDWDAIELSGQGGYSKVYKGIHPQFGAVAIKRVRIVGYDPEGYAAARRVGCRLLQVLVLVLTVVFGTAMSTGN